jgi:hypothetical protein
MCDECFEEMMKEQAKHAAWYVVPAAMMAMVIGPLATAGLAGGAALVSTAVEYLSTSSNTTSNANTDMSKLSTHSDDEYEVVSLESK